MTAQQVAELGRADELPLAASLPDVDVQATLTGESDQCCRHPLLPGEDMAPDGVWEVRYQFQRGYPVRSERVCPACAQDELQELLDWNVYQLSLHLPADWMLRQLRPEVDPEFERLRAAVERIESMDNTAVSPAGREGFEICRKACLAALASSGLARIDDLALRRAS